MLCKRTHLVFHFHPKTHSVFGAFLADSCLFNENDHVNKHLEFTLVETFSWCWHLMPNLKRYEVGVWVCVN